MRIHVIMVGATAGLGFLAASGLAMAQAPQGQQMPRMFMEADRNGDGVVDKNEYMQLRGQIFSRIDRNGDGQLTQDDAMEPQSGGPGMGQGRLGMRMQRADTNGDGVISRTEWDARTEELFALRDRNKDGKIEPDEMGPLPRTAQP